MTEVVLEQKAEVKAFSAFGKRNANDERIQKDEEELKQLLNTDSSEEKKAESADNEDDSKQNSVARGSQRVCVLPAPGEEEGSAV